MTSRFDCMDENQLIRFIIDASDLPEELRQHVTHCPGCTSRKEQFEKELDALNRLAQTLPLSPIRPQLPSFAAALSHWRLSLAASFAVILIAIALWWQPWFTKPELSNGMLTDLTIVEDRVFGSDFIPTDDFYLSEAIEQATFETNGYWDEEFIEYIAPMPLDQNSV